VVSYAGRFDSAEWIVEMPRRDDGALSILPDFKSIVFSSVWTIKNGRQRSLYAVEAFPVTMVDLARKTLLAHVSATGFDGQSFTVVRDKPGEPWWVPDGYQISR
jgi:hypothetical protein